MKNLKFVPREKRLKEIIIGQTIFTLLIIIFSLCLICYSFGYKIDWRNWQIRHTGIVYFSYQPSDADLYINGVKTAESSPYNKNLLPGRYEISIQREGYQSWSSEILLEADKVLAIKNIILFYDKPTIAEVTDADEIKAIDAPYDTLVKNPQGDLSTNDYEIWSGNKLVTRFSTPITNVIWYPGKEYIAYQQGNEIRIINKDGSNDVLLITLADNSPAKFIFSWDGAYLLYRDSSGYKKAKIT